MNKLKQLASRFGTKRDTRFHYQLFKDKRDSVRKVLEIGIGSGAAGLLMWRDFFPLAKVYGADNRGRFLTRRIRIESFWCDQSKKETLITLIEKTGSDLDIVIDNGSHRPEDQILTCLTLMPRLKKEVVYIIENATDGKIAEQLNKYNYKTTLYDQTFMVVEHKKNSPLVSIIIPNCNEIHTDSAGVNVLQRTVQDIYEKATGNIEVIVGFNGPEYQSFPEFPNLKIVKLPENVGIKTLINLLATMASGKYIYKSDAHCSFGKGFDEILSADMQDNWLVTPRFYVLDSKHWKWQDKRHYDYFYLCCPFTDPRGFRFKAGGHWLERTNKREGNPKYDIDETPQFHGSGWFVEKDFFLNKIGGFPTKDPMGHAQEPPNLGLKYWLGPWGGKVMVNKKTWYAHMHQEGSDKGYRYTRSQERTSYDIWARYWMGDKWEERAHNIDWFIKKFMPMPTWPKNWRKLLAKWQKENNQRGI